MIYGMERKCRIIEGPSRENIEGIIERIQGHIDSIDFGIHYNDNYPSRYWAIVVWWEINPD